LGLDGDQDVYLLWVMMGEKYTDGGIASRTSDSIFYVHRRFNINVSVTELLLIDRKEVIKCEISVADSP
jgi:hypothetical protein